jgi:predicted Zn-dependent protease
MKRAAIVSAIAIVIGCATNPATGRRQVILVSEAQEIEIGRESDAQIRREMGVYSDENLQRYVNRIGQSLARTSHRPSLPWTFAVVDESAVNAFALPGGKIYVTRGILPFLRDEAELAGVMGHEVGHVDAKHGVDQYSRQLLTEGALVGASVLLPKWRTAISGLGVAAQFVFLKYGRTAELEADRLGVGYASAAGWAPEAMQGVLGTLGRLDEAAGTRRGVPNWALSHPPAADRVAKIQEAVTAAAAGGGTATNAPQFEQIIDGIVFGDSREKGMIRGSEFVHPVLQFSVRFPDKWEILNGASQVSAGSENEPGAVMILELSKQSTGSVADAARADMADTGFRETGGGPTRINGLDAYVATYEGAIENTPVAARVAHIRSGDHIYLVAGLATAERFPSADRNFTESIRSFRSLSAAEAARIQPGRVRFHTVQAGDTWESLARRAGPFGAPSASSLAIMNGSAAGAPPRPGARIRIVVGG